MKILLVAATNMEIDFDAARHAGVDTLFTGVGVPACMYNLTKKLLINKYDVVIQAGIAGTFTEKYSLGQTILVKQDVFADLGIFQEKHFYTLFEKGFAEVNAAPYSSGFLINENAENYSLPGVNAITVNTVSDNTFQNEMYMSKYSADIESMEGAAFHYVCIAEGVRFIQLRSISNRVGERDKTKWQLKGAIQNLNENLHRIIKILQNN